MRYPLPERVETKRLLLRTWLPEDTVPLDNIYRQPEYLETMPPANATEQIAMWVRRWEEDGLSHWAACDRASGQLIGRIGLIPHHDWPLASDPVEVGWVLHRDWWGRGLATEGGRAPSTPGTPVSLTSASTVSPRPTTGVHAPSWNVSG